MQKDKSRGLKHFKDKRKYKGNSTKNPKYVPRKIKSNLLSNEDRYKEEGDAEGFKLSSSSDFSVLSNIPISHGYHFQFKQDKFIVEEAEINMTNELFSLDLKKIEHSILTIPFYERVEMDRSYFSETEIYAMSKEADENYQRFRDNSNRNNKIPVTSISQIDDFERILVNNSKEKTVDSVSSTLHSLKIEDNIVSPSKSQVVKEAKNRTEDDLEEWLDGILDD